MDPVAERAYARAGLLGNPSDGYEGKAIAFTMRNFSARVALEPASHFEIVRGPGEKLASKTFAEAVEGLRQRGCYDGIRLLRAAVKRFGDHWGGLADLPKDDERQGFKMSYTTDIPRQAGMSGSSAIIIAALRALSKWFGVAIPPHELAEMALAAELEDLGITAGPMDRVIQSYEGVMLMDFKQPRGPHSYERLDPALLPPLFVAYDPRIGEVSGKVHSDVRQRWLRGDKDVRDAIAVFPALVDEGVQCLRRRDYARFRELVNKNFDTRASIWTINPRDREMIEIGRALGAATKFCGSGGAIVGVMERAEDFAKIAAEYKAKGYCAVRPEVAGGE